MNAVLRSTILTLYRRYRRWVNHDREFRLARRNSRASGYTLRGFHFSFRRNDYAVLLRACRITQQDAHAFLQEAALERAHLILQMQNSGGIHESRVN